VPRSPTKSRLRTPTSLVREFQVWTGPGTTVCIGGRGNCVEGTDGFIVDWSSGAVAQRPSWLQHYEVSFYVTDARFQANRDQNTLPTWSPTSTTLQRPKDTFTCPASADNEKPWAVDRERRPYGLRVVLPKRTYVLPWAQFLYAEGAPDTVRAVFSMHDVVVTWCGLDALLADLAAQVVTVLQQAPRAKHFLPAAGPRVSAVEVRRIEGSGPS
jgi:hypothetical protein